MGAYEYQPVASERCYVNDDAPAGGDGSSWAKAFRFVQDALAAAQARPGVDEIWVAAGRYTPDRDSAHPTGSRNRAASIQLLSGIKLRGGFAGNEDPATFDLSRRDYQLNATVLSGDLAGNDGPNFANNGENSYQVVTGSYVDATAVLEGFTIAGGNANGTYVGSGAGAYLSYSNPQFIRCILLGNAAASYGGGVYHNWSNPTFVGCIFSGNSAKGSSGGGIYTYYSSPVLSNCAVICNSSQSYGGGLYIESPSQPQLIGCTIVGNRSREGGGLYGSGDLTNCIVWANAGDPGSQIRGPGTRATYSCIQGGWAGEGNISADPGLIFVAGRDLRLRRGSPCIDAGNRVTAPGDDNDLNGQPRAVDDPDTADTGSGAGPMVDIGCCEYQPVPAETLYVSVEASPGGDGSSWSSAYCFLQDALTAARARPGVTQICVAMGVYTPDSDTSHPAGTRDRTATFQLPGGVKLYGGFLFYPGEENNPVRDPISLPTVLSGDLAGNDGLNFANNGENTNHVVTAAYIDSSTLLDGFIITGGNARSTSSDLGAGVYNICSSIHVIGCTFFSHSAYRGAAVYNDAGSNPELQACTFEGNYASSGAGVCSSSTCGSLFNPTIGKPALTNCTFTRNSADMGGAVCIDNAGSLKVTGCSFTANSAGLGGGMYIPYNSTADIVQSEFTENIARNSGGGVYTAGWPVNISNCRFIGNSASSSAGQGGGLYSSSDAQLTGCMFRLNSASKNGGGIYNSSSTPTLVNCTVVGNYAAANGGALYNSSCYPRLTNCIVWDNTGPSAIFPSGSSLTPKYSCIQGGWAGSGNISADPRFVDAAGGDLRLRADSPCIDAGSNAAVPAGITTDVNSAPRFADAPEADDCRYATGTCGSAPIVDMGACEFVPGTRTVNQWRSVRSHRRLGPLSIVLAPAATGNGSTAPSVENRGIPALGLGVTTLEVDFDGPVSLAHPENVAVTCWPTVDGVIGAGNALAPRVTMKNATTMSIDLAGVPDGSCLRVAIGPDTIAGFLIGDIDCAVRSLAGDVNGDGEVTLADLAVIKANISEDPSVNPRLDLTLDGFINLVDMALAKSRMTPPSRRALCP
jgi:hypothetical protein